MINIVKLGKGDLEKIFNVERKAFIPLIQASKEKICKRFNCGHVYLGANIDNLIVGTLAFRYGTFSPDDYSNFPNTFDKFANQLNSKNSNSIFVYSLGIIPDYRGGKLTKELINCVENYAKKENLNYIVGDGRCPSYNGSTIFEQENIRQNLEFKRTIDDYMAGGRIPVTKDLLKDSTLAFYHKLIGLDFLWIMQNFIPEDKPAGGYRVILYKQLK
ncbi:MAG: GNAT family N-acetyltransferase [Nanoarchaeota archaeon]